MPSSPFTRWIRCFKPILNVLAAGGFHLRTLRRREETPTSRPIDAQGRRFYDSYNTAIELTNGQPMEFYHKSKLVVGVEYMPFASTLKSLIGDATIALGGTTGTLGTQDEREVFSLADSNIKVAPIICWEQDYGSYVRDYVQQGANLFAIMTNDGWWGNTLGHVSHFHYARLRAIENRRAIVRAANTGISGFIFVDGQAYEWKNWDETGLASARVTVMNKKPFFTQYGDLIGRGERCFFPAFAERFGPSARAALSTSIRKA